MTETAELIDNDFLASIRIERLKNDMAVIEYSLQERKIFLTKMVIPAAK
jgi:hypothetical protein